jgi:redox-sensitive bicupin YhaK (pirin superfamily)
LHGAQIYVNLSSKNKLAAPRAFWLERDQVPEWRSDAGDRVRVVVGSFEGVSSPLAPAEPFDLFDVGLRREVTFGLPEAHNALVYVLDGVVLVRAGGHEQEVAGGHALAIHGGGGRAAFVAVHPAHLLMLSGAEIREPVLVDGPFIMTERSQIDAAFARFRAGEMGHLEPLSES